MAILRREDGVQFVLQPYRELITLKNKTLLKKELQHLSESHGNFARIFKQNNHYEAVFARDSGYLLGEAIWQNLGKPSDLLYCEALADKQQALVVIVRDSMVYLDALIDYANFTEELAFLLAEKTNFAIYVYGDVPLSEELETNKFSLESTQIKSFTRLHTPLYATMRVTPELRLLSIERAIAELKLDQNKYIAVTISTIVIVLGLFLWWWGSRPAQPQVAANPLQRYQQALQTPNPDAQLTALAQQIIAAYNVPGWIPTKVNYSNGSAQFELHTLGSSVTGLLQWATAKNLAVNLTANGAILNLTQALPVRPAPTAISNSQMALATILDRMQQILPENQLKIGATTPDGIYQEIKLSINLANISPGLLILIGNALSDLPVVLTQGSFDLNNGVLTGVIQLSVLGN